MSHTKGHWESDEGRDYHREHILVRTSDGAIGLAVVRGWEGIPSRDECLANARLIAAAPQLLEACEAATDYMGRNIPCDNGGVDYAEDKRRREIVAKLDAAIRAAREGS